MLPISSTTPKTLEGQTRLLSHHLSGYVSCRVLSSIASIPKLSSKEISALCVNHRFTPLLSNGLRNKTVRNFVLPLLEKHLPRIIQTRLLQIAGAAETEVAFPKALFHEGLRDVMGFYDDLEQACGEVARKPLLSTTLDLSIEEAMGQHAER